MGLIASLGLDEVSGDPNDLPVGKYDGVVSKSEFVLVPAKKQVSHVVTYKVTDGEKNGMEKQVWYNLYGEIVNAEGNFPEKVEDIKGGKPLMTEQNKNWYKKLLMDLTGCAQEEAKNIEPNQLEGITVTFGVAEKNGYKNVTFVEKRFTEQVVGGIATAPTGFGGF
jgi:hypothetical protein